MEKKNKEDFGIKDTIEHILKATVPTDVKGIRQETKKAGGEHRDFSTRGTIKHMLKEKKPETKAGITPEQLLKLKKAREEFIKQGKYKEMEKKVSEEVKGIKEEIEKEPKRKTKEKIKEKTAERIKKEVEFINTGIEGLDALFEKGIPKGISVLVVGGPGTGKTLFCLHMANYAANQGEKCLYLSFEESEDRLKQHMRDFGWDPDGLEKKGLLVIKRIDPYEISRSIEALLAQSRGELLIDIEGISAFIPKDFKPDRIVIDSVTALTAAFAQTDSSYRSYIEQSFLFMEKLGVTSFLISESEDAPKKLSPSGIEEFLADGVIILYSIRKEGVRERAAEILKMRGAKFQERIVAMQITDKGIVVYPQQQVFGTLNL